jgi:hypothetical protein
MFERLKADLAVRRAAMKYVLDEPQTDEMKAKQLQEATMWRERFLAGAPFLFEFLEWTIVTALFIWGRRFTSGIDRWIANAILLAIFLAVWPYYSNVFFKLRPPVDRLRDALHGRHLVIGFLFSVFVIIVGWRVAMVAVVAQFGNH